jgi:biopolymer transport protein ExbB/TolQ
MAQFPISTTSTAKQDANLNLMAWSQEDVENRFGFKGGRYTDVNQTFVFLLGGLLAAAAYALALFVFRPIPGLSRLATMLLRPANQFAIIPATVFFFVGVAILIVKTKKVNFQKRSLTLAAVPTEPEFILTQKTAPTVLARIQELVDHPRHFILFNRIYRALSNLKNMGQINDVSSVLRAQAENDEAEVASSYTLLNGFVWGIPVLGFIGTVLGLSLAIGRFTSTLQAAGNLNLIRASLQGVTGGLATAFETTLIALSYTLILQMGITFAQKREMAFLDQCNDYCHSYIVSKLRLIDNQQPPDLSAVEEKSTHEKPA